MAKRDKIREARRTGLGVAQRGEDRGIAGWLKRVFDHPIRRPGHCGDINADAGRMPPERVVQHLTWLFRDSVTHLELFTPAQIDQGLWYLLSNSCSNYMFPLLGLEVSWEARRECIRAIPQLFSTLFAKRCSEGLSHRGEAGDNPLNGVCYMWWDLLPEHGRPNEPAYADRDRELLSAMEQILALKSIACQESALHGLGHWQLAYPQYVEAVIDRFLREHPYIRPELRYYAENAQTGYVQ